MNSVSLPAAESRLIACALPCWGLALSVYIIDLLLRRKALRIAGNMALLAGWGCWTASLLVHSAQTHGLPLRSDYEILIGYFWIMGLAVLLLIPYTRTTLPSLLFSGLGLFLAVRIGRLDPQSLPPLIHQSGFWYLSQRATLIVAYGLLSVAVLIELSGLGYARLERRESPSVVVRREEYVEFRSTAYQLVLIALPLLSYALLSKAYWLNRTTGRWWTGTPEEHWSVIVWLLFLCYLHMRTEVSLSRLPATAISIAGGLAISLNFAGVTWLVRFLDKLGW